MAPVQQNYASQIPKPDSTQLHGGVSLVGGDDESEGLQEIAGGMRPILIAQTNFHEAGSLTPLSGKIQLHVFLVYRYSAL